MLYPITTETILMKFTLLCYRDMQFTPRVSKVSNSFTVGPYLYIKLLKNKPEVFNPHAYLSPKNCSKQFCRTMPYSLFNHNYPLALASWSFWRFEKQRIKHENTVPPAVAATSIKRAPPVCGQLHVPPNHFACK